MFGFGNTENGDEGGNDVVGRRQEKLLTLSDSYLNKKLNIEIFILEVVA